MTTRNRPTLLALGALTATLALAAPATAADNCPNASVRAQQTATSLPQCRAYEIVTKPGNDLGDVNRVVYSSDDGDTQVYLSIVPGDDALGAGLNQATVARRTSSGWTQTSADPRALGPVPYASGFTEVKAFSPDFSRVLVAATLPLVPSDTNGFNDFYRVDVGGGAATLLSSNEEFIGEVVGGMSQDMERVFFNGTTGGINGLYVSDGTHRELVSVYPDGSPMAFGTGGLASPMYTRGPRIGGASVTGPTASSPFVERGGAHTVSDDGRRVYFSNGGGQYLRDLDASPVHTVAVSASSRTGDNADAHIATFLSASHDGSTAYIASNDQLTDAATPGGGIYRFDAASESVTQVSPAGPAGGLGMGGAIVSDDQSHIYFTSTEALAGAAQAGDTNLYALTPGGAFRFIAKVFDASAIRRVTPDGRYLLFSSRTSINGAPSNGFETLYRYDYEADAVACISCRADGSPSTGDAYIDWQSPGQPAAPLIRNRAQTFDGQVVFTSTDRLVPDDKTSAMDVYLYRGGTLSLLTSGRGDDDSFVGDVSDDGTNISVLTRSSLVRADQDAAEYDVYNVRIGGGFLEPAPPSDPCRGDDCQGPPALAPQVLAPSSSWATGAGNASSPRAARKLSVAQVSAAQRARLARSGVVTLRLRVAGGGRLSVRGRGRVGGRMRTLGNASKVVRASKATSVSVTLALSRAARKQLGSKGRLRVTFVARLGGLSEPKTATVNLTRAHR